MLEPKDIDWLNRLKKKMQISGQAHQEERIKFSKIRNERREITTDTAEIQKKENSMNNYMSKNWASQEKKQVSRNVQSTKIE